MSVKVRALGGPYPALTAYVSQRGHLLFTFAVSSSGIRCFIVLARIRPVEGIRNER